jgi:hypothetical protein
MVAESFKLSNKLGLFRRSWMLKPIVKIGCDEVYLCLAEVVSSEFPFYIFSYITA